MKLRQLPSGSWTTQVQVNGVRKSITHKSKTEVKKLAKAYSLLRSDAPSAPLGVLIDDYIASKRNVLSPGTVERYERIRKHYFGRLMPVPANEITADRAQKEINLMSVKYAPKTVACAWGLVSSVLKANSITLSVRLPARKPIEYHLPIEDQVYTMIEHASENLKTAILLAAFCSLRRSEVVALEADDIEGDMIHVKREAIYGPDNILIYREYTKTYTSDRYVFMPDIVRDQLKGKTGRVCPVVPSTITADFIKLRNKLGLTCRFHDLRHFYASYLHSLLIGDQYIQKWGGWKTDYMLKSVYRNTLDDVEKKNAELMNETINSRRSANEVQTDTRKMP